MKLGQKVTIKGTKDVSSKSKATVELEQDDKYFNPTFIKAKAGETITFKVKNEGSLEHTFTSDDLSVDKTLEPGKSATITVTVPSSGKVFQFHCQFHETAGMIGAVYTKAGAERELDRHEQSVDPVATATDRSNRSRSPSELASPNIGSWMFGGAGSCFYVGRR